MEVSSSRSPHCPPLLYPLLALCVVAISLGARSQPTSGLALKPSLWDVILPTWTLSESDIVASWLLSGWYVGLINPEFLVFCTIAVGGLSVLAYLWIACAVPPCGIPEPEIEEEIRQTIIKEWESPSAAEHHEKLKKARKSRPANVFFLVLKHNSLFLYEGEEQIVCGGVAVIEGCKTDLYPHTLLLDEIYKKEFPLRIVSSNGEALYENRSTVYLYAASASEKEDWLFALRQAAAQAATLDENKNGEPLCSPRPQNDPKLIDAIFMERLNRYVRAPTMDKSSQWINAITGRLFFNMFRSNDLERFFRKKFDRKIATMPKPFFLGDLTLKSVLAGQSLPMFSRGQLHSVTNQGELLVSVDIMYPGGFRMTIETEIKWDIPKVKTIVVPIVMSIHVRRLAGRALIRIKPPPSDRIWVGFYSPPQLEVDIEPVVSSKAITWSVIKAGIMKHMQDTMAEFVVLPNMDDFNIPPLIIGDCYGGEKPFELDYIPPSLMAQAQQHNLTAHGLSAMRNSRGESPEILSLYKDEGNLLERELLSGSHSLTDLSIDFDLAMDPLTSQSSSRQGLLLQLYDEARKSDLLAQEKTKSSYSESINSITSPVSASAGSSPTRTPKEVINSVRRTVSTFFRTRQISFHTRGGESEENHANLKTEKVD